MTFVGFEESEAVFVSMPLKEWASGGGRPSARKQTEREHWADQGRKRCTRCGEPKLLDQFHRENGTHDHYACACMECLVTARIPYNESPRGRLCAHDRNRRRATRCKRGRTCQNCGESHPAALVFHHRDPATKQFEVSIRSMAGKTEAEIETEIAKCDVLCANCHRKLHWEETNAQYAELEEIDSHRERQLGLAGT